MSKSSSPSLTLGQTKSDPFCLLVDAVVDRALFLVDLEGRITSWNSGAERIFGHGRDEIVGRLLSELAASHDGCRIDGDELRRRALATDRPEFEWRCPRKDASSFHAVVSASALKDDEGRLLGYGVVAREASREWNVEKVAGATECDLTGPPEATPESDPRIREERYRTLFERAPIGILYSDAHGTYLDANECVCAMLGYAREELIGRHASDIVAPDELGHIEETLRDIGRGAGHERPWWFRRKDGSLFVGDVVATKFPDGTYLGMIRDVTELQAREWEVARLSRLYNALSQINQAIVWTSTRDELFRKVCRALVEQGGFRLAWIGWHDPLAQRLAPAAVWGAESDFIADLEIYTDERPEGRGPTGLAFRTGRPCVSNDVLHDPTFAARGPRLERHGLRSSAVFPIRVGGAVCGTLSVYDGRPNVFGDKETALLAEAAADLSFALDNFARDEARRQAEQAALNEKRFNETMIESMPGIVYFYDETRRFRRWNKNFEVVSGYTPDEIVGLHPLDFFRGDDRANVESRIATVFESGEASIEAAFVAKDGSATPYYFTGRRVQFENQLCLVGMGIDLSERRRVEVRLAESERKYRELVEYANSIILRWNSAGRITFLNEFGLRFFGYTANEILNQHVVGTIVPSTESTGRDLEKLIDELCASPETFEQNVNECVRRTGERVWIAWTNRVVRDSEGRLIEILSVGSDITARRRAEVNLREAELRYHTLFEETPVGVVVVDPSTTAILESNAQAARQLGYAPDEFSRLTGADFEPSDGLREALRRIEQIVAAGRDQFEMQQRTKSGEIRDVFVSGRTLELGGRKVVQYVFLDVTERKAMQAEHEKRLRAEAADRIKSAFLATMSHELRTPLNSIIGFTGVLLQGLAGPLNVEQNKQLDMVRTSARHLLALVNDILDISKIEAGQIEIARKPFSVERAVAKTVALVKPAAEKKGVPLRVVAASEIGEIVSDERRFEQILLNLLGNAVKFTDQGEIVVAVELVHAGSHEESSSAPCLQVRVSDSGIGIRAEDLKSLFQPFRQIDSGLSRKYEGTGLGLAISSRLVELMGGRIAAESRWGEGSTFTVTLPLKRHS